jgi:ketosteroid isomerase-like protein
MKRICVVALLAIVLSVSQLACSSGNQANANAPAKTAADNPIANTTATPTSNPNQNTVTTANANTDNNPFTELVMLYSQLFTARMKGDKAKVAGLLADDYKETTGDGKVLTKAQVLAGIDESKKSEPFSMDELKSTESGDTGTVTGRISVTGQGNSAESWQFSTTFKKQQGKWRASSNKITNYKKS